MLLQDTLRCDGNATGTNLLLRTAESSLWGMLFMKRTLLLTAIFVAALLQAATPDLSGEWKLNLAKSDYGKFPTPLGATRRIAHNDPKLMLSTTQQGAQSNVVSNLVYTTDGKESVNKESKGVAQWIGDKLMIESSREVGGATLKQKEIWTLSPDGKSLIIDSHVSLPNGEFDVKQVFEKQ